MRLPPGDSWWRGRTAEVLAAIIEEMDSNLGHEVTSDILLAFARANTNEPCNIGVYNE